MRIRYWSSYVCSSDLDEIDAFHHAPIGDVQAGNDSGANCHISTPTTYTGTGAYRSAVRLGVSPSICHLSKRDAHSGQAAMFHPAAPARAAFTSSRPSYSARPARTPSTPPSTRRPSTRQSLIQATPPPAITGTPFAPAHSP